MTAAELAISIISKCNNAQACKFVPRGPEADTIHAFLGRPANQELFITENQFNYFKTLANGMTATSGEGEAKLGSFVKEVWSERKGLYFFLLVWGGKVPASVAVSAPVASPMGSKVADHSVAANIIANLIKTGKAAPDSMGKPGDDYLCAWIPPAVANTLIAALPASAMNTGKNITTQVVGSFCYWTKIHSFKGAMLLCWMGEPIIEAAPEPAFTGAINEDADIPF